MVDYPIAQRMGAKMPLHAEKYRELAAELANDGIICRFQASEQFTLSWQSGNIWPDKGNSFWVTYATGVWHLVTWSPIGYYVPPQTNIAQLCRQCMSTGQQAMHVVPEEIIKEYALRRLTEEDLEALFGAMEI